MAGAPAPDSVRARVDAYLQHAVRADHFSGTVLVARGGQAVAAQGYGMASYELAVPNTPRTRFRIASLTKAFTAAAILLLQEQGRLRVDDPICPYLDASLDRCPPAWRPVTVRHLLTHTSGIPNYTHLPGYEQLAGQAAPEDTLVARFRDPPLDFPPGTQYRYSNSGYHLLGLIIERVSGQAYGAFLRDHVFEPLGMHDTGRDDGRAVIPNRADGYTMDRETRVRARYQEMTATHAEGGLSSTAPDLLRWDQALSAGTLLSRASLQAMFTPGLAGYGYGWDVARRFGRPETHHLGRLFGFTAYISRLPAAGAVEGVTVIVLSNNEAADVERVATDLAAIGLGARRLAPALLAAYAGTYADSPTTTVTITAADGRLFAQGTGSGTTGLYARSETRFFMANADAELAFHRDGGGRVAFLTLRSGGHETTARRLGDP